jgi:hypothetical protein
MLDVLDSAWRLIADLGTRRARSAGGDGGDAAGNRAERPEAPSEAGEAVIAYEAPREPSSDAATPVPDRIEAPADETAVVPTPAAADDDVAPIECREPETPPEPPTRAPADAPVAAVPDPDLDRLVARSAMLETQMLDLTARLAEMEQRVREFEHRQYQALGEVLDECLRLRQEYLRLKAQRSAAPADLEAARRAAEEFDAYRRTTEETRKELPALDEEERDELRGLYRAAAMRCHPDRVAEADKASAHGYFLRIQEVYRKNDLAGLRRVLAEIDSRQPPSQAQAPRLAAGGDEIRRRVGSLQIQVADLILAIQTLQLNVTYRQATRLDNWDAHFARSREQFEDECDALRAQIDALAGSPF